MDKYMTIC